jgi:L-cysteine:1D-myo-inositol 2-amino-2-deoxy-alpha-D-glucopyranoside ligase
MSKSRGNLVFVDRLRAEHDPRIVRLVLITHHYRSEWEWSPDLMAANADRLARWQDSMSGRDEDSTVQAVRDALDDDLDAPSAVRALDEAAAMGLSVRRGAALLGIDL